MQFMLIREIGFSAVSNLLSSINANRALNIALFAFSGLSLGASPLLALRGLAFPAASAAIAGVHTLALGIFRTAL
jgi:hypothetical protein